MSDERAREIAAIAIADARGIPEKDRTEGMMAVFRADAAAVITTAREQALREAAEKIRVLVEEVSEAGIQASQRGDFTASSREGAKVSALIRAKDRILSLLTKEPKA